MIIGKRRVRRGRLAKVFEEKQRVVARMLAAPPPRSAFEPRRELATRTLREGRARLVCTDSVAGQGSFEALAPARRSDEGAIVAVDFIVHPLQLRYAAACGADGAVLIARLVDPERFEELVVEARRLDLELVAEVATPEEGAHASALGIAVGAISEVDRDHIDEKAPRFTERTEAIERALAMFEIRIALEAFRDASPWANAPLHARYASCFGLSPVAAP